MKREEGVRSKKDRLRLRLRLRGKDEEWRKKVEDDRG